MEKFRRGKRSGSEAGHKCSTAAFRCRSGLMARGGLPGLCRDPTLRAEMRRDQPFAYQKLETRGQSQGNSPIGAAYQNNHSHLSLRRKNGMVKSLPARGLASAARPLPFKGQGHCRYIKESPVQGWCLVPPYGIGGKPNAREAGGCFPRAKYPPVSLREPSPLFPQGGPNGALPLT
jgi:hypothetical protein